MNIIAPARAALRAFNVITRTAVMAAMGAAVSAAVPADVAIAVRHAPDLGGQGRIEGSLQMNLGEGFTVNGGVVITHELIVPGTPELLLDANAQVGGLVEESGSDSPSGFELRINGGATIGLIRSKMDPSRLPESATPMPATGNRSVTLSTVGQSPGSWSTVRDLRLNGTAGILEVPAGAYGAFTANGQNGFRLGTPGAASPAEYHFGSLTLNGQARLEVLGPVIVTIGTGLKANGIIGSPAHPEWLQIRVAAGAVQLNSGSKVCGAILAPVSPVIINSGAELHGTATCDRFTLNGDGLVRWASTSMTGGNRAPVAESAEHSTDEDTAIPILLGAQDPDGNTISYQVPTRSAHGTISGVAPNVIYSPDKDFAGADSFAFTVSDGNANSAPAIISISVKAVNDPPVAVGQAIVVTEDTPYRVTLAATDVDGDDLTYAIASQPSHGTLVKATDPTAGQADYDYLPAANSVEPDSFTFVVTDGKGGVTTEMIRIAVNPINDRPVVAPVNATLPEDGPFTITLTGTDPDGDALTVRPLAGTGPHSGRLIGTGPEFTYQPNPDFSGEDSFWYEAVDSDGVVSAPAEVRLAVTAIDDSPVVVAETIETQEDSPAVFQLRAEDVENEPLAFDIIQAPNHGRIEGTGPTFIYIPDEDYAGDDEFTVVVSDSADPVSLRSAPATVSITVHSINDTPVAHVQAVVTTEDTPVEVTLSGRDADGDPLVYRVPRPAEEGREFGPTKGNLVPTEDPAVWFYAPAPNSSDDDRFTFRVEDPSGAWSDAVVTIAVTPVNDRPEAAPLAVELFEDESAMIRLSGHDVEDAELTFSLQGATAGVLATEKGYVEEVPPNLMFRPLADAFGDDGFNYIAIDSGGLSSQPAPVAITILPVNDRPVAEPITVHVDEDMAVEIQLTATDTEGDNLTYLEPTDPSYGVLEAIAPGRYRYHPQVDFNGADSFVYAANDGELDSLPAPVTIVVRPINDAPIGLPKHVTVLEDRAVGLTLEGTDADGDPLTFSLATAPELGPKHGTVTSAAGGLPALTYRPYPDYSGPDTFAFTVRDPSGQMHTAEVSIWVQPENDAPSVEIGPDRVLEQPGSLALNAVITDIDGTPEGSARTVKWEMLSGPEEIIFAQSAAISTSARFPVAGTYTLQCTVDDSGLRAVDQLVVTVRPANIAPLVSAGDDRRIVFGQTCDLSATGTDDGLPGTQSLRFAWQKVVGPGVVTFSAPTNGGSGSQASFDEAGYYVLRVTCSDGVLSSSDLVTVLVEGVNMPPVVDAGADFTVRAGEDASLTPVVTDDGLPRSGSLLVVHELLSGPGVAQFENPSQAQTTVRFTAPGEYQIQVRATDGEHSTTDQITVMVLPAANRAPSVSAGNDQNVSGLRTVTLFGEVLDDGLPTPALLVHSWRKVSGPGEVIFTDAQAVITAATFSGPGEYVLELAAYDSELADSDSVTVQVSFENQRPVVDAGPDLTSDLTRVAVLQGRVSDDGSTGTEVSWSVVNGPGEAVFNQPATPVSEVTFSAAGTYSLRLTGNDGSLSASDDVVVTVRESSENAAPVVDAGSDRTILPSQAIRLLANVEDDGLPSGSFSYSWELVAGPIAWSPADPTASEIIFSSRTAGTYVFLVTVSDGALTGADEVVITVERDCEMPEGLAAWWPLEGDAVDKAGSNNGVMYGAPPVEAGKVANALSFNGTSQYVTMATAGKLDIASQGSFSVEFWFKPAANPPGGQPIVACSSGTQIGFQIYRDHSRLYFDVHDQAGTAHRVIAIAPSASAWHHIVASYGGDDGMGRIYVDGALAASANLTIFRPRTGYDISLARLPAYPYWYKGALDEVSLYNRVLSPSEVSDLFIAGESGKCGTDANLAPKVNAGFDQTVPEDFTPLLSGDVTDDGLPGPDPVVTTWGQTSGPALASIQNTGSLETRVRFPGPGTYVFTLNASDGGRSTSDQVSINVVAATTPISDVREIVPYKTPDWRYRIYSPSTIPTGFAQPDFDDSNYLTGPAPFGSGGWCPVQSSVSTLWPVNTDIILRRWVQVPAGGRNLRVIGTVDNDVRVFLDGQPVSNWYYHQNCAVLDDTRLNVGVPVNEGWHLLVVQAHDFGEQSFLELKVLVDTAVIAHAGVDQSVVAGQLVTLDGAGSRADTGSIRDYQWTQVSGPSVALDDAWSSRPAFHAPGVSDVTALKFRLVVSDGRLASTPDDVIVTVSPAAGTQPNAPPSVNAGPDREVSYGSDVLLVGTATDDGLPSGVGLLPQWSVISGPGPVNFEGQGWQTVARFSRAGVYRLSLKVSDGSLEGADDLQITVASQDGNRPPRISLPESLEGIVNRAVFLDPRVSDDGLPNRTLTFGWQFIQGPASVAIVDPRSPQTAVRCSVAGTYTLRLTVSDSQLSSHADVRIVVRDPMNSAPIISAGPDLNVTYGTGAVISPEIADDGLPNGYVMIGWEVMSGAGGVGLIRNESSDAITATFGRVGTYILRLIVSDGQFTSTDDVAINVTAGTRPNPVVVLTSPADGVEYGAGSPIDLRADAVVASGQVESVSFFANGSRIGEDSSEPYTLRWIPPYGDYIITARASDDAGITGESASVVVKVRDRPLSVTMVSPASGASLPARSPVLLSAFVSGGTAVQRVKFEVEGTMVGYVTAAPYQVSWSGAANGEHHVRAIVSTADGQETFSEVVGFSVIDDPGVGAGLELSLDAPVNGATLTKPTEFRGTVKSSVLKQWRIEARHKDQDAKWTVFGTGTSAVTNGSLGTLDTTLLKNGIYEIRLVATDLFGRSYAADSTVLVDGDMKIGQFTVAFQDLQLPLSGIPITLTRIYDSRDRNLSGDFGFGWNLDVSSVRLERGAKLGDAWVGTTPDTSGLSLIAAYSIDEDQSHAIAITLPDGQVERFRVRWRLVDRVALDVSDIASTYYGLPYTDPTDLERLTPEQREAYYASLWAEHQRDLEELRALLDLVNNEGCQLEAPPRADARMQLVFEPLPGTHGTLEPKGVPEFLYRADTWGGAMELSGEPEPDLVNNPGALFKDATGWTYAAQDGRRLDFDANGRLEKVSDLVGNSLTITPNGIFHSSGQSIVFQRDASGRITAVTDPAGKVLTYQYDARGDLRSFFDRTKDPAHDLPSTAFTYSAAHYLTDIMDARGIQAARNFFDASGRLYKTIDATGKSTLFNHDLGSRSETITDRSGHVTKHSYDDRGNITRTETPDGTVTTAAYHRWPDGTLSSLKTSESISGLFTNDAGQLVQQTFTTRYSYEDEDPSTPLSNDGLLRKLTDPNGNSTRFEYDSRGNVLRVDGPGGDCCGGTGGDVIVSAYYPGTNLLHTITDALGNVTTYTYDVRGNPDKEVRHVTVVDAAGASSVKTVANDSDYDRFGRLQQVIDPHGHITEFERDTVGNVLFQRTSRSLEDGTRVPVVTEHTYDAEGRLVKTWDAEHPRESNPDPTSETVYDALGKPWKVYDPLRNVTESLYNARGELETMIYADGSREQTLYDAEGRREYVTDRRGKVTQYVYDSLGRLKESWWVGSAGDSAVRLSSSVFDAAGRVVSSTDPRGFATSHVYDPVGRRTATVNARAERTHFEYDSRGNVRFVTDAKGRTTEHVYDALNRRVRTIFPVSEIWNGTGLERTATETVTAYDELGRRVAEFDQSPIGQSLAARRSTRFVYDLLGRLSAVVDPLGQVTSYQYDELGNQLTQTDARNSTTRYGYDSLGRRVSRILPAGQSESCVYDAAGRLQYRTDFNGETTEMRYDALGRLRFRIPGARPLEHVEWRYTASGQREWMIEGNGRTTQYGYDGRDRLSWKAVPEGTITYGYDDAGHVTSIRSSTADGSAAGYTYDELGRLATVTDANQQTTEYRFDGVGNLENVVLPNGVTSSYGYDENNRLAVLMHTTVANSAVPVAGYHYKVHANGRRHSATDIGIVLGATQTPRIATYGYDALWRLKSESVTGDPSGKNGSVSYGYDAVGNREWRTSSIAGLGNQTFGYDANDRINGDTYDANGNTRVGAASQTATAYSPLPPNTPAPLIGTDSYDGENRLTQRTSAAGTVQITYDADGHKVRETVVRNGVPNTTTYLVDELNPTGYAQVIEEKTGPAADGSGGTLIRAYTYGLDLISQDQFVGSAAQGGWQLSYYGYDGHGNVRFLTDPTGQVSDTYTYDAFGALLNAGGSTANRYLYCGEVYDLHLGLYYLRARLMNPLSGRFFTKDAFEGEDGNPKTLHLYSYAEQEPVGGTDPSGYATLVEVQVAQTHSTSMRKREASRVFATHRAVRRSLCATGALLATNLHHVVPVMLGESRSGGKTVRIPENFHQEFHRLLHYMLVFAGYPGGNVDREEYRKIFMNNPASRKVALTILVQAGKIFDRSCSAKIGFSVTPIIRRQIRAGAWDF